MLLTKLDSCPDPDAHIEEARAVALGVPVHAISVHAGIGLEVLHDYLQPARTVALIGSSGVGKSTLLNHCLGEQRAPTCEARADDDKGRHTTSARELFMLKEGAMLIDTPGMREIGLTDADAGLDTTFADIEALAASCRFAAESPYSVFDNCGQDCCARSRILVERSVHERVVEVFAEATRKVVVGDPADDEDRGRDARQLQAARPGPDYIEIGRRRAPISSSAGRPRMTRRWPRARTSCRRSSMASSNDMRIAREEIFGPVVSIIPFDTEAEAIAPGQRDPVWPVRLDLEPRHRQGPPDREGRPGRASCR